MTAPGSGGSGPVFGGSSGVGGGTAIGGSPPFQNEAACRAYCVAYSKVCPGLGFGDPNACERDCTNELQQSSDQCASDRASAYECIASTLFQSPDDCEAAVANAKELCGSATGDVPTCKRTCSPSVFGDSNGCHAAAECQGTDVDLHCFETNGSPVPCTCTVGGQGFWKASTQFDSAKSACLDADLFRLCERQPP